MSPGRGVMTSAFRGWNKIYATGMERVALADAFSRQPCTAQQPVFTERIDGIVGTTWVEPAIPTEPGCECHLIKTHQPDPDSLAKLSYIHERL